MVYRHRALVDILKRMQYYAFDVISEMTASELYSMLAAGKDETSVLAAIHESSTYGSHLGHFSEFHYFLWDMTHNFGIKSYSTWSRD